MSILSPAVLVKCLRDRPRTTALVVPVPTEFAARQIAPAREGGEWRASQRSDLPAASRADYEKSAKVPQACGMRLIRTQARRMCYAVSMSLKLSNKKLAVLGAGKLGSILLRAYLKQGLFVPGCVTATVRHSERAAALAKQLGVAVTTDNRAAVKSADIVLLTVKPQTVGEVLREIAPELNIGALLVSVAASVPGEECCPPTLFPRPPHSGTPAR